MIEKIYENYPEVVKGPDFETFFYENPDLLSSDGVHPSESGYSAMRELWAKTMYDEIYSAENVNTGIDGDVNADGRFNIADAVTMQKWLLCEDNLTDWKAGDLYKDDVINVFDLCLMKRMLIEQ